jgi:hypothetical protein
MAEEIVDRYSPPAGRRSAQHVEKLRRYLKELLDRLRSEQRLEIRKELLQIANDIQASEAIRAFRRAA